MSNNFIKYANSFQTVSKLGLESTASLLSNLKNPQKNLKFIHVAGTNGKGSVCSFLQSILTHAGYKTGKFTSPDMLSVCERISIGGINISDNDMNLLLSEVQIAAKETEKQLGNIPTQFEIWTAAALLYFERKNCDIVVLEVGLGGRLDATNIIDSPLASVITRIDIDHISYLGDTIEKITKEKCGIIKPNAMTITIPQNADVVNIIKENALINNNRIIISEIPAGCPINHKETFDYKHLKNLTLSLSGMNQIENASLAIETALALNINEDSIRFGLSHAKHIGRFEIISNKPITIYDGAHNKNGFTSLLNNIERYYSTKNITFICAFMKDKDISEIFTLLNDYKTSANIITTTVLNNERAETAESLCKQFSDHGFNTAYSQNVKKAYELALKNDNLIVICGSLYLYKDLMS